VELVIDLLGSEWEAAHSLLRFAHADERTTLGMVQLTTHGGRRRWTCTNSRILATATTELDERDFEVLVSPRLIQFALGAARTGEPCSLRVTYDEDGDAETVTAVAGSSRLALAPDSSSYPPAEDLVQAAMEGPGASAQVDGTTLERTLEAAARRALPDDTDAEDPLFWLTIDEGLQIDIAWASLGFTHYAVEGPSHGRARRAFPASQVAEAVRGLEGEISVRIPDDPFAAMSIHTDDRTVLIMAINTTFERDRGHVEALLQHVFGPDVLHRDNDGDYRLTVSGVPVYARLTDDQPPMLQVFAVVLVDIEPTPELMRELNDHNANLQFTRVFWVDGQVLAESDLVAATADPEEVETAFVRTRQVSIDLGPMLSAVLGGETTSTDDQRWINYLGTIVEAEVAPGSWAMLNGSGALVDWPFTVPVHVLTAWNPLGRNRPLDVNQQAMEELASALFRTGTGTARALGRDGRSDSDYAEPGFLVWGLDIEVARDIGRRFDQEAIFEIDADEIRVVGCFDDRVTGKPRRSPVLEDGSG
jgi:hypothetical protein